MNRRWDLPLDSSLHDNTPFLMSAVTSSHMEHTATTPCTEQMLHQRVLIHIQLGSWLSDLPGKASLYQNWPQNVPQPQPALLDQARTIRVYHWSQERESRACCSNKQPWPMSCPWQMGMALPQGNERDAHPGGGAHSGEAHGSTSSDWHVVPEGKGEAVWESQVGVGATLMSGFIL